MGSLCEDRYTSLIISCSVLHTMRSVSEKKLQRKSKHTVCVQ